MSRSREGLALRLEWWFTLGEEKKEWSWLAGLICCLSKRGFPSVQKLGGAEVKELGKALNMWGRPRLARMSAKEIINP